MKPQPVPTNSAKTVLTKEQFKELYTFLSIIKHNFVDFNLVSGHFRSRTNCKNSVVEVYFEYFKNMNFTIPDVKKLFNLISLLSKKTNIEFICDGVNIRLTDGYQKIKIRSISPKSKYCENTFLTEDELNKVFNKFNPDGKLIISATIPKPIVSNIDKTAQNFGTNRIKFTHAKNNLNKGCLVISSKEDDPLDEYEYQINTDLFTKLDEDHYSYFVTFPFAFRHSDMTIDLYFLEEKNIVYALYGTKIDGLSITIYCRGSYIEP